MLQKNFFTVKEMKVPVLMDFQSIDIYQKLKNNYHSLLDRM